VFAAVAGLAGVFACRQIVGIGDNPPGFQEAGAAGDAGKVSDAGDAHAAGCGLAYPAGSCGECANASCCAESRACAASNFVRPVRDMLCELR
jgi:hypothetical protein